MLYICDNDLAVWRSAFKVRKSMAAIRFEHSLYSMLANVTQDKLKFNYKNELKILIMEQQHDFDWINERFEQVNNRLAALEKILYAQNESKIVSKNESEVKKCDHEFATPIHGTNYFRCDLCGNVFKL